MPNNASGKVDRVALKELAGAQRAKAEHWDASDFRVSGEKTKLAVGEAGTSATRSYWSVAGSSSKSWFASRPVHWRTTPLRSGRNLRATASVRVSPTTSATWASLAEYQCRARVVRVEVESVVSRFEVSTSHASSMQIGSKTNANRLPSNPAGRRVLFGRYAAWILQGLFALMTNRPERGSHSDGSSTINLPLPAQLHEIGYILRVLKSRVPKLMSEIKVPSNVEIGVFGITAVSWQGCNYSCGSRALNVAAIIAAALSPPAPRLPPSRRNSVITESRFSTTEISRETIRLNEKICVGGGTSYNY